MVLKDIIEVASDKSSACMSLESYSRGSGGISKIKYDDGTFKGSTYVDRQMAISSLTYCRLLFLSSFVTRGNSIDHLDTYVHNL